MFKAKNQNNVLNLRLSPSLEVLSVKSSKNPRSAPPQSPPYPRPSVQIQVSYPVKFQSLLSQLIRMFQIFSQRYKLTSK